MHGLTGKTSFIRKNIELTGTETNDQANSSTNSSLTNEKPPCSCRMRVPASQHVRMVRRCCPSPRIVCVWRLSVGHLCRRDDRCGPGLQPALVLRELVPGDQAAGRAGHGQGGALSRSLPENRQDRLQAGQLQVTTAVPNQPLEWPMLCLKVSRLQLAPLSFCAHGGVGSCNKSQLAHICLILSLYRRSALSSP